MIRLFRWLIFGDAHHHHWVVIRRGDIVMHRVNGGTVPGGYYYDMQCDVCGNIKCKNT